MSVILFIVAMVVTFVVLPVAYLRHRREERRRLDEAVESFKRMHNEGSTIGGES